MDNAVSVKDYKTSDIQIKKKNEGEGVSYGEASNNNYTHRPFGLQLSMDKTLPVHS